MKNKILGLLLIASVTGGWIGWVATVFWFQQSETGFLSVFFVILFSVGTILITPLAGFSLLRKKTFLLN